MKKAVLIILMMSLTVITTACNRGVEENSNSKTIPELQNVESTDGKNVLTSMGLIPVIEETYNDTIKKGQIINTEPPANTQVEENSRITIYVSKGPSYIESKNSVIEWINISSNQDNWEFYSPYIQNDILYIECEPTFAKAVEWSDDKNSGTGFGQVSVNDNFDKVVPVNITYDKKTHKAKETQTITLEVPLNDLQIERPTDLYFKLAAKIGGEYTDIIVDFTMSW